MAQVRILLLLPLILAAAFAYVGAFLLRFEWTIPRNVEAIFVAGLWLLLPFKGFIYWGFRLHTIRWRHVGLSDLVHVVLANITASFVAYLFGIAFRTYAFPRSIYVLDAALAILATAAVLISVRLRREVIANGAEKNRSKLILIYGAGTAGSILAKETRSNRRSVAKVAGFLDDDVSRQGGSMEGIPILGTGRDAARVVAHFARGKKPVTEIVLAMPSANGPQMRTAISHCREAGIPFRTLPTLSELLNGKISAQIREVSADDLLGREPIRTDERSIEDAITGETVLVTGGCGSIGSELCRQVARFNPRKLIIFDQAESEMFMLALELRQKYPNLNLVTELGDIFRMSRVRDTFMRHAVNVVFHAAAYKHVPLMEASITEAIENNVIGTYNVARAAHWSRVKKFVLISSDKAVNPTSIMGVTKRIAELIVAATPLDGSPQYGAFVSVRFGNVLGSVGSVVPVFRRQIAAGGPVTITHPDMRRYFMSVSEAVQLVLQASAMGERSEVFVLDMGEPVRIIDLACNMIQLAGFVPGRDIQILVSGLRPGEKLFEELRIDGEDIVPTPHEKIKRFRASPPNAAQIARWLGRLRILLAEGNPEALKAHLLELVPEYQGAVPTGGHKEAAMSARAS